jgi:hypothetical protein
MDCETEFIEKNRQIIEKHNNMFNGHFMYHVPDGNLFYENDNGAYFIPENETIENLQKIILEDIEKGINSIPNRYKKHIITYEPDIVY